MRVSTLSKKAQEELNELAAAALFEGGQPMNLYNQPAITTFLKKLNTCRPTTQ